MKQQPKKATTQKGKVQSKVAPAKKNAPAKKTANAKVQGSK
jgi:hypothetical protein